MNDSTETTAQALGGARRWLLLIHSLPPKPDYLRVKVRRRLQRIGAAALKSSVYVLPNTEEAREDFEWLLEEIRTEGGQAFLCVADFVGGLDDAAVAALLGEETMPVQESRAEVARGSTWV